MAGMGGESNCELCGRAIPPHQHYVVRIDVFADPELRAEAIDGLRGTIPADGWYWNASRAISHPADQPGPITEFPAFTYLYADLHAHAMALPFEDGSFDIVACQFGAMFFPDRRAAYRGKLQALVLEAVK